MLYEFSEPSSTSSQVTEMICITVRAGSVGTALIVTPQWIPNTATGKSTRPPISQHVRVVMVVTTLLCSWSGLPGPNKRVSSQSWRDEELCGHHNPQRQPV